MEFDRQRRQMIADIEAGVAFTRNLIGKDRLDRRVMTAMRQVPRENFVPPDLRYAAFRDGALPVGHGQTISQPYIVALMTDMLQLTEDSSVLEIGTGTGYQAAILSCLASQVYSIERIVNTMDDTLEFGIDFARIPPHLKPAFSGRIC